MARTNLQARRRLSALYQRGVEIRFGPNGGRVGRIPKPGSNEPCFDEPLGEDEVAVWIGPPNPMQREEAMRDAQAVRARALIALKRDENSEEQLTSRAFIADMDLETLKEYVLIGDADERRQEAMRDVLAQDEWKDITALQDALRQFEEDNTAEENPDDPEFKAVMERDAEYGRQVGERFESLTDAARDALSLLSVDELERRALERRADVVGSQRFMAEYERQMTFFSVREVEDRSRLFFDNANELSEQDDIVQNTIKDALAMFINEGLEAKNSLGAVSGSDSSELPSEPEISEASTPLAASA